MACKYQYIDNNSIALIESTARGWQENGKIDIIPLTAMGWNEQVSAIETFLSENTDGFILDWRLNERNRTEVRYSAEALAEQIRFFLKQRNAAIPIIIVSQSINTFREIYKNDLNVNGLFDAQYSKDELNQLENKNQLIAIAGAYKTLNELQADNTIEQDSKIMRMLDVDSLSGFFSDLLETIQQETDTSVSAISQFVLQEMIKKPGKLIDEEWLAARLGIDKAASNDWQRLKDEHLINAKYTGIFAGAWDRWWTNRVEDWWNQYTSRPLQATKAQERVELIRISTNLVGLQAAQLLPLCTSEQFWVICEGYKKPMSSSDGMVIAGQSKLHPWQQKRYVSIHATLNNVGIENWKKVARFEQSSLQNFHEFYDIQP